MTSSDPLRIGLLGASRIAELAITEAARETGDERAAVAARDPERARAYAAEHGYHGIRDSYAELIADDSLDLIYIGLPNGLHAEWTVRALEAGRSVLVEKPLASNLPEFDRMAAKLTAEIAAADAAGTAAGWAWEAFHYADHPLMSRLIEIVRNGEIGAVGRVRVAMTMPGPPPTDPRWSFDLAGGAIMDLGCYAINALLLVGEALDAPLQLISAQADLYATDARVDAAVRAEFTLGAVPVEMWTDMQSPEWDFSFEVQGTRGSVFAPNFVKPQEDDRLIVRGGTGSVNADDWEERVEHMGKISSYTYQLQRIRKAVRRGDCSTVELERSRRTMALIDQVYETCGLPLRPGRLN
ncbi:Gfo/Idh/MocA family protein [Nesterenkonia muleiensis]|uniref:Gfo/Idh/MocA family protein n=1 Tax=Nesterenkonia muleiensis TaxID=2282648 RepID=UPI000E714D42|nr:Gfo/Idh/MocA family oxidoreductase [Nesterenkonia muleiensis]